MPGVTNLNKIIKTLSPKLNKGDYVFCTKNDLQNINNLKVICLFKESEGYTFVLPKEYADELKLKYSYTASWITLCIHTSLEAVGLTAIISNAFTKENISCNIIAAYYHDHIFVAKEDTEKALDILNQLSETNK